MFKVRKPHRCLASFTLVTLFAFLVQPKPGLFQHDHTGGELTHQHTVGSQGAPHQHLHHYHNNDGHHHHGHPDDHFQDTQKPPTRQSEGQEVSQAGAPTLSLKDRTNGHWHVAPNLLQSAIPLPFLESIEILIKPVVIEQAVLFFSSRKLHTNTRAPPFFA